MTSRTQSAPLLAPREAEPKATPLVQLSGWGRLPMPGRELASENLEALSRGAVLARGLGRSYGDSSLPADPSHKIVNTTLANRILAFDEATGLLRVEAGVCLADLNRIFMPRGWFTPVTPGTKFVTLGGMVASDVHGKNHHVDGCFGAHVQRLRLRLGNDDIVECSPSEHADLFWAAVGGMGLVGHILELDVVLKPIASQWIWMESERVANIDEYLAGLTRAASEFPMTMGWLDCLTRGKSLGRGILMAGRWATPEEVGGAELPPVREISLPVELPNWVANPLSTRAFNTLYYYKHFRRQQRGLATPDKFFYPLDGLLHWNKGYGSRGFTQYQCVIPRAAGAPAVREFMELLTKLGAASPLCVIKDCGPEGQGLLSFPLEGTSIAVDMPVTSDIQRIVDKLNELVIAAKGRIYLTKDRFTRAEHFAAMEPRLPAFFAARDKWDPGRKLESAQSVRLFGARR